MAFSRTNYDSSSYKVKLREVQAPFYYTIFQNRNTSCNPCHSTLGTRANRINTSGELTQAPIPLRADIESLLTNRNIPHNKSEDGMNLLHNKTKLLNQFNLEPYPGQCNDFLNDRHTRLNNNILDLRSVNIDRFEYPIISPLEWVSPVDLLSGTITRNDLKDNFEKSRPRYVHNQ